MLHTALGGRPEILPHQAESPGSAAAWIHLQQQCTHEALSRGLHCAFTCHSPVTFTKKSMQGLCSSGAFCELQKPQNSPSNGGGDAGSIFWRFTLRTELGLAPLVVMSLLYVSAAHMASTSGRCG